MRHRRLLAGALILLVFFTLPASAAAGPGGRPDKPERMVVVKRQGEAFCFDRALSIGNVVIAGGRCYTFYLTRTSGGVFLAFGPPGPPMIPPGQLVRLSTPAGKKMKGRLFYLVPVPVPIAWISVDTIRFVAVVVAPRSTGIVITVPKPAGAPAQEKEIELVFVQR